MFQYISVALRGVMTLICTGSSIAAKLGPEIGITPAMLGFDARKQAEEWIRTEPWNLAFSSGMHMRYFIALYMMVTVYCLWNKPAFGAFMFAVLFVSADQTTIHVSQLTSPAPMANSNCPNGAAYCPELLQFHYMLAGLGLAVLMIELLKGSPDTKTKGE